MRNYYLSLILSVFAVKCIIGLPNSDFGHEDRVSVIYDKNNKTCLQADLDFLVGLNCSRGNQEDCITFQLYEEHYFGLCPNEEGFFSGRVRTGPIIIYYWNSTVISGEIGYILLKWAEEKGGVFYLKEIEVNTTVYYHNRLYKRIESVTILVDEDNLNLFSGDVGFVTDINLLEHLNITQREDYFCVQGYFEIDSGSFEPIQGWVVGVVAFITAVMMITGLFLIFRGKKNIFRVKKKIIDT